MCCEQGIHLGSTTTRLYTTHIAVLAGTRTTYVFHLVATSSQVYSTTAQIQVFTLRLAVFTKGSKGGGTRD